MPPRSAHCLPCSSDPVISSAPAHPPPPPPPPAAAARCSSLCSEKVTSLQDPGRRGFTYFMLGTGRFLYATAGRLILLKFVGSMSASADVLALASAEFSLGNIEAGNTVTVKWRGKPVFIRHRTEEEIAEANAVDVSSLRDPQSDTDRTNNQQWLVALGVCTHLGCVPITNAGDYKGWFCPCHGSHYDNSGRIRKGPAPLNLEVPPYDFLSEDVIKVG
jgi:ubiquinol-cytochrome c reductase iron-sulfur subunit